jgi:hypothetical protein
VAACRGERACEMAADAKPDYPLASVVIAVVGSLNNLKQMFSGRGGEGIPAFVGRYIPRTRLYRVYVYRRVGWLPDFDDEFPARARFENLAHFQEEMLRVAGIAKEDFSSFVPYFATWHYEKIDGKSTRIIEWHRATEFREQPDWTFVSRKAKGARVEATLRLD